MEETYIERMFQYLTSGDRAQARTLINEILEDDTVTAEDLSRDLYWPVLDLINTLFRADQMTTLAYHYATRLLRSLVDQIQVDFDSVEKKNRRILLFTGPGESDELAGQIVADLAEADGYEVLFGGGGVANDEILKEVGTIHPDVLLMFSSAPRDAPHIRKLIDTIKDVDSCPNMQIVVGGGVFTRAEGLAEEIGADLWANDPVELLYKLETQRERRATPDQRTVGRGRRNARSSAA